MEHLLNLENLSFGFLWNVHRSTGGYYQGTDISIIIFLPSTEARSIRSSHTSSDNAIHLEKLNFFGFVRYTRSHGGYRTTLSANRTVAKVALHLRSGLRNFSSAAAKRFRNVVLTIPEL